MKTRQPMVDRRRVHAQPRTSRHHPIAVYAAPALFLWCHAIAAVPMHWVYEAVDPEKTAGGHAAVVDAADYAHVVYGRDALHYDYQDAEGWHSEVADATSAPQSIAMVLDNSGYPHVVYVDMLTHTVKYAGRDPTGWSVETLGENVGIYGYTTVAICLDSAGWPHAGYADSFNRLKYSSKDASGWHSGTVPAYDYGRFRQMVMAVSEDGELHLGGVSFGPSLFHAWRDSGGVWHAAKAALEGSENYGIISVALDGSGHLHAVYCNDDDKNWDGAVYVLVQGAQFQTEQLFASAGIVGGPLAVTRGGVPHVIVDEGGLQHWTKVNGMWRQTIVDPTSSSATTALLLDPRDQPHIFYETSSGDYPYTYTAKRAWQGAEDWHTELDPGRPHLDARGQLDLMMRRDSRACVAYSLTLFSDAPGTVFYWQDDAGWHERVLAQPGITGIPQIRLVLDAQGHPHVGYHEPSIGSRHAWRNTAGWQQAIPLQDGDMATFALDNEGHPHFVIGWSTLGCLHAVLGEQGWERTVIDTDRARRVALALDAAGRPHVLAMEYQQATDRHHLVHLWLDPGGWNREAVLPTAFGGDDLGIAVDTMGEVHICYYDNNRSYTLQYGHRTTQGWQFSTVDDNGAYVGHGCSLDLDERNRPHIAYGVSVPAKLRFARKDAAGWHISTVSESSGDDASYAGMSLSLAPDGTPHITYRSGDNTPEFCYARPTSTGWEVTRLEEGYAVGSLAMDQRGRPHIAYCNTTGRQNLGYLYAPPFALTGLTPPAGGPVRLDWQGALEGVGVDGAPTPSGPWSPVAEDLCGLACEMEVPPAMQFFRLRNPESP